jgi:wyosine [tRNA(Phe)-imidazoG37] synthetase (radical SAM superfamily)
MTHIFGPIPSRRFGNSLGIDLSTSTKQCNFDCLYCELEPAKAQDKQHNVQNLVSIQEELFEALNLHDNLDVITLTANGEPTLYPYLDEIIEFVNKHKGSAKSLILSNASTIDDANIQASLAKLDIVKLSLDAVTPKVFKKIDRSTKRITIETIIDGIKTFKSNYNKELVLEVLFVQGVNDSDEEVAKLVEVISEISPTRVDLSTIDRPPAYEVKPISKERLFEIAQQFEGLPVTIASRQPLALNQHYSDDEIVTTLGKRPLTYSDIEMLFDDESQQHVKELIDQQKLITKVVAGVEFISTKR